MLILIFFLSQGPLSADLLRASGGDALPGPRALGEPQTLPSSGVFYRQRSRSGHAGQVSLLYVVQT